ncbi:MAG: hypothetical protein DRN08_06165 [Thermoplasmata archaeon]|nr:MAG: hypothetical protein DRN08_06165 [Thermoplasmata archaeon]
MKKIFGLIIITMFMLAVPCVLSFTPEKGFYAEYRLWKNPELPETTAFALLKEHKEWEVKYFFIKDLVYKYQILDIKNNIATIRICFEGTALGYGHRVTREEVPFRRIFDIKLNLDTLEMIDDNGDPWGKWLFWVKLGSYDWKEYTVMKNWNNHGNVRGWIDGPYENDFLFEVLHSPYLKDTTHFFCLITLKIVAQKHEVIYPSFEEYGIIASYKDYKTSEGSVRSGGYGGYYLDEIHLVFGDGEEKTCPPGLKMRAYYTEDGLLLESYGYWIDDFVDQKLGIVVLNLEFLYLTDYGVSNDILIEEPTLENQRTSFKKEVEMMVGKNEPEETPSKTENPPETTETPQEKSETQLPTTQPNNTEETNILYYIAPLLVVAFIAVFLVLKEKR